MLGAIVKNTSKWIDLPSRQHLKQFLYLTNGEAGMYNSIVNEEDNGAPIGRRLERVDSMVFEASSRTLCRQQGAAAALSPRAGRKDGAKYAKGARVAPAGDEGPALLPPRPWCGTFEAMGDCTDVHFMTVNVPHKGEDETFWNSYNPHLIRYYMERVWQLKRPDVIITVTGGALAFDMSTEDKDKIMKGMMDGTRNLDAWFVTG